MRVTPLFAIATALCACSAHAAEGFTPTLAVNAIEVGRTGEHIIVYVTTPLAECDGGVFRLYRNQFGLTVDGQRFNLSQLQIAKITGRSIVLYHSGAPSCFVANVMLL